MKTHTHPMDYERRHAASIAQLDAAIERITELLAMTQEEKTAEADAIKRFLESHRPKPETAG